MFAFWSTSSRDRNVASTSSRPNEHRYGLIAGNGRFPFLVLEAAKSRGIEMVVAAIREETALEIEEAADRVHWMSLGQLGKLIKTFKSEGVDRAVMAGQVKHRQIFSGIVPDLTMLKLLGSLATKSTDSLIGAVARLLEEEGILLMDSTAFLEPLMPARGVLTARGPSDTEQHDIDYGVRIARELGRLDLGQSVVVADGACVALEAMEGTDAVVERAARLANGRPLVLVKLAKPNQDLRFDVPVVGPGTLEHVIRANVRAVAIEAGKTLMIDREDLIRKADANDIAILAVERETGA